MHALYYTDKVCSEPLTPLLYLSDMRQSIKGYTEILARVLKAWVLAIDQLERLYRPFCLNPTPTDIGTVVRFLSKTILVQYMHAFLLGLTQIAIDPLFTYESRRPKI